jgi:hypothetical protein
MEGSIDVMVNYSSHVNQFGKEMQKTIRRDKLRIKKPNYSRKNKSRECLNYQHNFKQNDWDNTPH